MEVARLVLDPGEEVLQGGLGAKRLNRVQASRQLGFGKAGVDGAMADLMQKNGFALRTTF